ncbi:thymidine kinase [Actinocatenispora comari]|uniref:Thymidine kinase n=1 Tax=Actinocatenispora comari TaxID=2807577 RepID=A0A8J4AE40_9ACTN|nr:thymidine kinase [Actinocatenispora comari]
MTADLDDLSALARPVPRGDTYQPARLKFFHGPMDCGKSTLALQMDHNHARQGRRGLLLTRMDRSGAARISTRIGLDRRAIEVTDELDLRELVRGKWALGARVDYLICDEVQFFSLDQVEQLADLVDHADVDVYAFGLATDFRSELFPATKRLLELADGVYQLQVEVLCWCGRRGQLNARVVGNRVVREGEQVLTGDTGRDDPVHYQVLCRAHYRSGDLGPAAPAAGQLPLG